MLWAEGRGFTCSSVMDHLIQIPNVCPPDEPFMERWTVVLISRGRLTFGFAGTVPQVADLVGACRDAGVQLLISTAYRAMLRPTNCWRLMSCRISIRGSMHGWMARYFR